MSNQKSQRITEKSGTGETIADNNEIIRLVMDYMVVNTDGKKRRGRVSRERGKQRNSTTTPFSLLVFQSASRHVEEESAGMLEFKKKR